MNKFVILFALVASAFAEPPSHYGQAQYEQQYSHVQYAAAPVYELPEPQYHYETSGGDSGDSSDYVDDALLARIAQILEQHENGGGSSSGSSGGYEQSTGYGAPAQSSGGIQIGRPERAQRIAEFDITEQQPSSSGGYQTVQTSGGY